MNKIGIGVIILGAAALITAIGTAVVNFMSLKWAIKAYEPVMRLVTRSEPMMNKVISYSEKWFDEQAKEEED